MSMYALDTNIISFSLKENKTVVDNIRAALKDGHSIIIPPIVYYEVRRGLLKKDARKQTAAFDEFCGRKKNWLILSCVFPNKKVY